MIMKDCVVKGKKILGHVQEVSIRWMKMSQFYIDVNHVQISFGNLLTGGVFMSDKHMRCNCFLALDRIEIITSTQDQMLRMYRQSHVPLVSFFNIMQVQNCCESYVILVLPLFTCITVLFRTTDNCVFLVGDNPSYICLLKQTYFLLLLNILKIGLQLTGIKIDATSCLMCCIDASC